MMVHWELATEVISVVPLTESLDEVKLDLMMKINASDVDEKIEERYEDIVDHLMKALKTVQDDEVGGCGVMACMH